MKTFYLTHNVTRPGSGQVDARAICDEINKKLGDAGCATEADCIAEIENIDSEIVALYGIHAEGMEAQE